MGEKRVLLRFLKGFEDKISFLVAMSSGQNIFETWLQGKQVSERQSILQNASNNMVHVDALSMKGIIEQLAAGVVSQCADELGLTVMELNQLLKTPRKDALSSLITIVECVE